MCGSQERFGYTSLLGPAGSDWPFCCLHSLVIINVLKFYLKVASHRVTAVGRLVGENNSSKLLEILWKKKRSKF